MKTIFIIGLLISILALYAVTKIDNNTGLTTEQLRIINS